jgi:CBS domain-containing protein
MFSVYGVAGQLFRGSLEKLRQIGAVGAVARTNAVQAIGRDGRDVPLSTLDAFAGLTAQAPSDEAHRSALAAYAESTKISLPRHPLRQVEALMSSPVVSLAETMTVLEAWQTLARQGVGQAPVVSGTGMLIGLFTRAELFSPERLPTPDSSALVWRALLAQRVTEIMRTPVPSVAAQTDIRSVARVLLDTGLPGLPVVDEQGRVTGFVSRSDLLRAVVMDPPLDLWG